jgi:adenylyltransferase/sulfurtransferase
VDVLTDEEIELYSRQILLPEIGGIGQESLLRSTVTLVGHGFLTDQVASYLARAGIGRILRDPRCAADSAPLTPDVFSTAEPASGARPIANVVVDTAASLAQLRISNCIALQSRCPLVWADAHAKAAAVAVLGGHRKSAPCGECVAPHLGWRPVAEMSALSFAAALWAAGKTATEVLRTLLDRDRPLGQIARLDVATSAVTVVTMDKRPHCKSCGF